MSPREAVIAGAVVLLGGALALNVTGAVRIPVGPLGSSDTPVPGSHQMAMHPSDHTGDVYTTAMLDNSWPLDATLDAVRPLVAGGGGAEVLGAQQYGDSLGPDQTLVLGSTRQRPPEWSGDHPVAGTAVAAGTTGTPEGTVVLVRAWADQGRATDVAGYEVDYRVGPFTFRAISTINSLVICSNDDPSAPADCDDASEARRAIADWLDTDGSGWSLGLDDGRRDPATLAALAAAAGYDGDMARVFAFTLFRDDGTTRDVLVVPGDVTDWVIATPLD